MRPTDPVDLDQILRAVIRNLSPLAESNQSAVTYQDADSPVVVPGDPDQLLQVITNLVENALKYGGQGTQVAVSLTQVQSQAGLRGDGWMVSVKDNGPGIDSIHIARLTERFYRIDSHRSREMGGTGRGAEIVKTLSRIQI